LKDTKRLHPAKRPVKLRQPPRLKLRAPPRLVDDDVWHAMLHLPRSFGNHEESSMAIDTVHFALAFAYLALWAIIGQISLARRRR